MTAGSVASDSNLDFHHCATLWPVHLVLSVPFLLATLMLRRAPALSGMLITLTPPSVCGAPATTCGW